MLTTDKNDPLLSEIKENGQQAAYVVLSEEERAKGFVRPVRDCYIHRGTSLEGLINPRLLEDEGRAKRVHGDGYYGEADYTPDHYPLVGRVLTKQAYLDLVAGKKYTGGCGGLTTMHRALAETYARDPNFYGGTFCVHCGKHLNVGEFVWDGTNETVGS